MNHDRVYQLTSIGRPLDPTWATNRAVMFLLPLLGLAGAALAWSDGGGATAIALGALRAALLGFLAWALARELVPDDQVGAFIAMGIALSTLINVPEPGFLLLFLGLALARVMNRSTGLELKKTDAAAVLVLASLTSWDHASPVPLAVTALAFGWGVILPGGPRWQAWPSTIALVAATIGSAIWGLGVTDGEALSRHGIIVPAIFGAGFLLTILATRMIDSVGDVDRDPLSVKRVRAGMWIVLLLVTANLAHGSPLAAKGVALWSVLGGVALGRVVLALRRQLAA